MSQEKHTLDIAPICALLRSRICDADNSLLTPEQAQVLRSKVNEIVELTKRSPECKDQILQEIGKQTLGAISMSLVMHLVAEHAISKARSN